MFKHVAFGRFLLDIGQVDFVFGQVKVDSPARGRAIKNLYVERTLTFFFL